MKSKCFIVGLLLLGGCARFQPRPISPADTAAAYDTRSLNDPGLKLFLEKNLAHPPAEWPLHSWDFEQLTLAAFYFNPSLDVARAQWQVATGGEKTAAQRPNPTLTASPGYDFTATSIGLNPWLPGVSFDLPIETMGKRGYRKAQARQLSESARLNIATVAWQVRGNLRASLVEVVAARERETLLEKQNQVQEKIIGSLHERIKAGESSASELTLSQVAMSKTKLDLADAHRQKVDAEFRLADAIGLPEKVIHGVEIDFKLSESHRGEEDYLTSEARDTALRSRTDILGALADYAATQSALQLEIAKQYPDIHFGPLYQYNQGDHQFNLAITAELPMLNQNQGPIAEAAARRAESAARFNALQAKVINEIDHAVAACRVSLENSRALQAMAHSQRAQNESVSEQAKAGAADRLELLNSQLELATGELAQLDGRLKAEQSFDALEDAVQRPLSVMNPQALQSARSQPIKENKP